MRNFITVALLGIATFFLTGCTAFRVANAWMQSKADFVHCTVDPRVFCEPGSEALAAEVAPLLPQAIETIEAAQFSVWPCCSGRCLPGSETSSAISCWPWRHPS